ncbi:MAG: RNase adapter RapZ, partial [Brachymonas sp.]|nr:RNase adapter RapZ [Brachymonas sp.]
MSDTDTTATNTLPRQLRLVMISGMSGAGKSVALHALEDAGYYCVDNLPPALLESFLQVMEKSLPSLHIAISTDARSSAEALAVIPEQIAVLRARGVEVIQLFLDATNEIIMRRYSETRRKHPLTRVTSDRQHEDLLHAIERERLLLAPLREGAYVIDTTMTRAAQLRTQIKEFLAISHRQ